MKKVSPKQYIIEGIPKNVNLYLQAKARQEKKSLNQVIIECLQHSLDAAKKRKEQAKGSPAPAPWPQDDARLEKEAAYLDILDADPSI